MRSVHDAGLLTWVQRVARHLWPGAIQRKAAQAVSPAGKESFADGDMAAGKRIDKSHANLIGPHHPGFHLAVVSVLPEEAREVIRGAHQLRADSEIQSLENNPDAHRAAYRACRG